ncbi:hypothetical protein TI03_04100 [Achromatium sp. WMS1]|nr:hypothetical protein TI03_04100 [Achromatium sp. WMS1]
MAEAADISKVAAGRALDGMINAIVDTLKEVKNLELSKEEKKTTKKGGKGKKEGAVKKAETSLEVLPQVSLVGFGTFGVKKRAARTGRNPKTGEPIEIAEAWVPNFKAGKMLKDAVK